MAFKVHITDRERPEEHGDTAMYRFLGGGVLEVRQANGEIWYHNPRNWEYVSAEADHPASE